MSVPGHAHHDAGHVGREHGRVAAGVGGRREWAGLGREGVSIRLKGPFRVFSPCVIIIDVYCNSGSQPSDFP